jgi:RNA polymerase sigma factor (sigma-70 family)
MQADDSEFTDWYRGLWPKVLRSVTVTVGDRDLAEEATAEAFARAYARWPEPLTMDSPLGWLHKVAVNDVRGRWRRSRLEKRVLARIAAQPHPQGPPPEVPDDAVWNAVAALPARTRQMIALRYVLDMTDAQVAETLGVSRGHVSASLSRARKELGPVLADARCVSKLATKEAEAR